MTKSGPMNTRQRNHSAGEEATPNNVLINSRSMENTHIIAPQPHFVQSSLVECFVSLANDQIISVEVESKAQGEDVIKKICQHLGIVEESAYFGLQYKGKYHETLWLNLRNRLSRQISHSPPYRLDFRVKYFVQPHTIIADETRYQFYLHAKNFIIEGCWHHGVPNADLYQIIALMTQTEFGNYHHTTSSMKYALFWPKTLNEDISSAGMKEISHYHQSLMDWTKTKSEYELLRLISDSWIMYGVSFQDITDCFSKSLKIGVGPEGVYLCSTKYILIQQYIFDAITKINYTDKVIEIELIQDNGQTHCLKYCAKSAKAAQSFQRYVTETHSFFKCETVDNDIIENCKNVSHFFKKTNSCRSYMYDVVKTSREVYDSARRRAYSCSSNASPPNPDCNVPEHPTKADSYQTSEEKDVDELRKELEMLRELVQCIVCKDRKINRLFIPCMHIVCCEICASRVNQCPICRKKIQISHHAYPRWINDNVSVNKPTLCTLPEDQALSEVFTKESFY